MGQGCTAFCLFRSHPGLCAYRGLFDPLARVGWQGSHPSAGRTHPLRQRTVGTVVLHLVPVDGSALAGT